MCTCVCACKIEHACVPACVLVKLSMRVYMHACDYESVHACVHVCL